MSLVIQNIIDPNDSGTVSNGTVGLFAGPGGVFYTKQSTGATFAVGGNKNFTYNNSTFELELTDDGGTVTASLSDIASGFFNQNLSFSQSNDVLSIKDAYSTLTASLAYYSGGFNTGMDFNTSSNVLTIYDGHGTISATLSSTGANTSLTFNPLNNILSIVDGFGTKTASVAYLSGNTGLSIVSGVLSLQDGRGTLTASLTSFVKIGELDYTTLNVGGTTSIIELSSIGEVPSNSKIVSIYGKVNQAFVSPTGQITGYSFYAVPGGTSLATYDWTNFTNAILPSEPFTPGNNEGYKLFAMTQSYFQSNVFELVSSTSSLTYSVYLSYSNGVSSVVNPQDWTSGNVSFVVEYQELDLSLLPF